MSQTSAQPGSGFPVELAGVGALHAAFLNESRTRGRVQRSVQEIRRRAGRRIQGPGAPEVRHYLHPGGAAPLALKRYWGSMSQPFRAGLTFGSRPYGPDSDLRFAFEFSPRPFRWDETAGPGGWLLIKRFETFSAVPLALVYPRFEHLRAKALRDLVERKVLRLGSHLIPPALENATITERNELTLADAELLRRCIDPVARSFQFGIDP